MSRTCDRRFRPVPLFALAAALAAAGCSPAPEVTDNALVDVENAADADEFAFDDEAPVIEDVASGAAEAVTVAAVPRPPANAPAAESAPLTEANRIEDEIRAGTGVSRVRYGEGWAWMRDGRILRTADRDGGNVAYFRRGEDRPFLVQRGDRAWGYADGRVNREFDRDGRGRAPDAGRAREAEEAAREARERRERAEQARQRVEQGRGGPRATPMPTPTAMATPTPSPTPTARGPGGRDREDRPGWGNRPTPTPTASPTGRRDRGDRDDNRGDRRD